MPSFLERLRLKNIFDSQMSEPPMGMSPMTFPSEGGMDMNNMPDESITVPSVPEPGSQDYDIGKRMKELYTPTNDASTRLNTMLDAFPQREKPSLMKKLGASLIAYKSGLPAGEHFIDKGFNDKVSDWSRQILPVERSANLERQNNVNERTLAYQTVSQELRQQAEEHKVANNDRKAAIAEHRASIYDYKAKHPDAKMIFPKGGNVQLIDPKTHEVTDTGIPTGSMSELDKMHLAQDNKLEQISATGDEARTTEGVKQTGRLAVVGARGAEARDTKATPSGNSPGNKPETPTQTKVRQYNAARELANSNPALRPFIKMSGASDFQITPPSEGGLFGRSGPTKAQYDEINSKIYGQGQPSIAQPGRTNNTPANKPNTSDSRVEPGRVIVYDVKTGKEIAQIPEGNVARLDKTKYTTTKPK